MPAGQPLAEAASSSTRLPGIEGLRAAAASAIVVIHVWLYDGGELLGATTPAATVMWNLSLGVTLFFALSGFLLYRPFAAAIARGDGLPDLVQYVRNRALRIVPAYWAILLVSALLLGTTHVRDGEGDLVIGPLDDPVLLLETALLVQNFTPGTLGIGVGPAWSLAVEAVFYLVLPLLVLAAVRLARGCHTRSRRVAVLLAPPLVLLLVGLTGKYVAGGLDVGAGGGWRDNWYSVVERSFWAQADLFAFGMAVAVAHTEVVDGRLRLPRHWRAGALGIALLVVVGCALTLDRGQLSYLPQNTAVALAASLLVAAACFPAVSGRAPLLQRLLQSRPLVVAGIGSYSVFLWHEPVIIWLTEHGAMMNGPAGFVWNLGLTAVVVGVLSLLSYRLVERPALSRKRRVRPADVPLAAAQLKAAP